MEGGLRMMERPLPPREHWPALSDLIERLIDWRRKKEQATITPLPAPVERQTADTLLPL
jgi:hypothetical protein